LTKVSVVVPFKATRQKSRLSAMLSEAQRKEFAFALLLDLLDVLKAAGLTSDCIVVTSDPTALAAVAKAGGRGVPEPSDRGVNSAVRLGIEHAGTGDILVVPSDLPFLRASEVRALLSFRERGADVVVSPSGTFNGTNALLSPARLRFPLSYDDDSFWNHVASAARLGLTLAVYSGPGVLFDVDSPSEFAALAMSKSRARSAAFARRVVGG
jgi:2-phospho-L-lactate/phosphoenolpyruvate guanylyltransferase